MDIQQLRAAVALADTGLFIDAWLRWRGERPLPRRSDVDLRDIARLLGVVMLCEVRGPDEILIRVCGTRMRELADVELTGKNYKDVTAPQDWPERSRHFLDMARLPCGGYMHFHPPQASERDLRLEAVSLPLDADPAGQPRQVIACNVPSDPRFDPLRPGLRRVRSARNFRYIDIGAGLP